MVSRSGPTAAIAFVCGVVLLPLLVFAAACSSDPPEVPAAPGGTPDVVLTEGRDVFGRRCAACHGVQGQGASGPSLADGASVLAYPDRAAMEAVVAGGKGAGMPAFGDSLDADQIAAVVRYVREVL